MANTTNLNLEKPLDTDQALISVINSNSDKIDAYAGSTNQALAYLEKPTQSQCSSLDNVKTVISSAISGMADNEVRRIVLSFASDFAPFYSNRTVVELYKANANNFSGIAFNNGATAPAVEIKYTNSTWYFYELARKIDTPQVVASGTLSANTSATFAATGGHVYMVVCSYPYGTGCMFIVYGWSAGAGRVTTIKASTATSCVIGSNTNVVTISTTESITYTIIELTRF